MQTLQTCAERVKKVLHTIAKQSTGAGSPPLAQTSPSLVTRGRQGPKTYI